MRGRIPDATIDEIARRVDIVELIGRHVTLERKGQRFMGLCPFHAEKTPSFSVDADAGLYYCFGCQRGGGVYKFVMEMEGLTFPEAVRQLGEEVGVEVAGGEEDDEASRASRALGELYNRVAKTFEHFLRTDEGSEARKTLHARAISAETIERFGVGYALRDPYWLHGFLRKKGYSEEFLETSGLFTRANPRRALFAGRIVFPIRSHRGDVLAFGGRIIAGDGPKYLNSPETTIYRKRETLFGIDVALKAMRSERHVVLAEGYMDVIALHQAGVETAVAPLGTSFTEEQGRFLARYADGATLLFDADAAGSRATRRAAEILEPQGITASVSVLEEGTDPADLLRARGSQAVLNAVSSPLTVLEFLVRQSLQEHAASNRVGAMTPEGKDAVLRGIYPVVALMDSEVKREESLRHVCDLLGVDEDAVRRDFTVFRRSGGGRGPSAGARDRAGEHRSDAAGARQPTPARTRGDHVSGNTRTGLSYDLFLMLATVQGRKHFAFVRRYVQPEDLEDPVAREVYIALEESFRREETTLETLMARITKPEVVTLVHQRIASGEFAVEGEQAIRDAVLAIRRRAVRKQIRAVETELRRVAAEHDETGSDYMELLSEKMLLDRELEKLKGEG